MPASLDSSAVSLPLAASAQTLKTGLSSGASPVGAGPCSVVTMNFPSGDQLTVGVQTQGA
jgi:hypothetical protein